MKDVQARTFDPWDLQNLWRQSVDRAVRPYLQLDTLTNISLVEAYSMQNVDMTRQTVSKDGRHLCADQSSTAKSIHGRSMHESSDIPDTESLIPTAASDPAFASK